MNETGQVQHSRNTNNEEDHARLIPREQIVEDYHDENYCDKNKEFASRNDNGSERFLISNLPSKSSTPMNIITPTTKTISKEKTSNKKRSSKEASSTKNLKTKYVETNNESPNSLEASTFESDFKRSVIESSPDPISFIENISFDYDDNLNFHIEYGKEKKLIPMRDILNAGYFSVLQANSIIKEITEVKYESMEIVRFIQLQVMIRMKCLQDIGFFYSFPNEDMTEKTKLKNGKIRTVEMDEAEELSSLLLNLPFYLPPNMRLERVLQKWLYEPFPLLLTLVKKIYERFELKLPSSDEKDMIEHRKQKADTPQILSSEKNNNRTDKLLRSLSVPIQAELPIETAKKMCWKHAATLERSLSEPISKKASPQQLYKFESIDLTTSKKRNKYLEESSDRYVGSHFSSNLTNVKHLFRQVRVVKRQSSIAGVINDEKGPEGKKPRLATVVNKSIKRLDFSSADLESEQKESTNNVCSVVAEAALAATRKRNSDQT